MDGLSGLLGPSARQLVAVVITIESELASQETRVFALESRLNMRLAN